MTNTRGKKRVEFYFWIHSAVRKYIEIILDIILVGLVFVTLAFIIKYVYLLWLSIFPDIDVHHVISKFLFLFILIEMMRILITYIEFHQVSVDIMVELAIVTILREIILEGALKLETMKILGISFLIIVLGLLLKFGDIRRKTEDEVIEYKPFFEPKTKGKV